MQDWLAHQVHQFGEDVFAMALTGEEKNMARLQEEVVYRFDELDEQAKDKAREWFREGHLDYEWYDGIFDDAKECGKILGIEINKIYFSGFWSQGDGACFEGSYCYNKGSVKAIKEHAPEDKELHSIAIALQKEQRKQFYKIGAKVKHSGHYYHENCTLIDVWNEYGNAEADTKEAIKELLRDFMRWIYRQLKNEFSKPSLCRCCTWPLRSGMIY